MNPPVRTPGERPATHQDPLDRPVREHAQPAVVTLHPEQRLDEALASIRGAALADSIAYLYVVDAADRLAGVLPVRRLLVSPPELLVRDVMVRHVHRLPLHATVLDACEAFAMHKLLALPLVDGEGRLAGVVDVGLFTEEVHDLAERERQEEIFAAIGLRVAQVRDAGLLAAWRARFPWLLATMGSGLACALLTGVYQATLEASLALVFFMTLVLGLGESVGMQAMTVAIQGLHHRRPRWRWFAARLRRELGTAGLLGAAAGLLAALAVFLWRGEGITAAVVGGAIALALCSAATLGLAVPTLLHALRLDPKIAAGPVALALADLATLAIYFNLAALVL